MEEQNEMFDLDISNYSIPELSQLLNLPNDFTENNIVTNTQKMIEEFNILDNNTESKEYVLFFKDVKEKLLLFLEDNDNDITNSTMITNTQDIQNNQPRYNLLTNPNIIHDNSHYVIESKVVPTSDMFSDVIPTGIINPIRRRSVTQLISIDTKFRSNYNMTSSTNYLYTLPVTLNKVISMRISSIEIPNIWYVYSTEKQSNTFIIDLYNMTTHPDATFTITIPDGNYTSEEMTTALNNYFNNVGNGLEYLTYYIDAYTGKSVIRGRTTIDAGTNPKPFDPVDLAYSPNFSFSINFKLADNPQRNIQYNCGWSLGFRKSLYLDIDSTNTQENNINYVLPIGTGPVVLEGYLESEGAFGSSVNQYLFLAIDDFNKSFKNSIISENDNSYLGDSILGRITVNSGSSTLVLDNGSDKIFKKREFFGPVKIEKMNIKILDKFGNVINLNNNDYSFALEFTQLYS